MRECSVDEKETRCYAPETGCFRLKRVSSRALHGFFPVTRHLNIYEMILLSFIRPSSVIQFLVVILFLTVGLPVEPPAVSEEIKKHSCQRSYVPGKWFPSIENGDLEMIKQFVRLGANVNEARRGDDWNTALMYAAEYGHSEIVKYLIEAGAEVGRKNQNGRTALFSVAGYPREASERHRNVVRLLIEAGADPMSQDEDGKNAVMVAAANRNPELLRMLMDAGADVHAEDQNGKTALMMAKNRTVAEILIREGAKPNATSADEKTALNYTFENSERRFDVLEFLLQSGANPEALGWTPLFKHVFLRNDSAVKKSLNGTVDPGKQDVYGRGVLWYAANRGAYEIVKLLLNAGASVRPDGKEGSSPLMTAAVNGHQKIVDRLLSAGADAGWQNNEHRTALFSAAAGGNVKIMETLLQAGGDVNQRTRNNWTPLHEAVHEKNTKASLYLIETGSKPDVPFERDGSTPLIIAARKGLKEVAAKLIQVGANVNHKSDDSTALYEAASAGEPDLVKRFIEAGAEVGSRNRLGKTPLIRACQLGRELSAKILLREGADPNAQEGRNFTALFLAASKCQVGTVKLLVRHGARVDKKSNGRTPLDIAVTTNCDQVVKYLVRKGARLEYRDHNRDTALMTAVDSGQLEVVRLMIEHGANLEAKNERGETPLLIAANGWYPEMIRVLLRAGANYFVKTNRGKTPLDRAKETGCREMIDILRTIPARTFVRQSFDRLNAERETHVRSLIRKLGAASYKTRVKATKKLMKMGEDAMFYLKRNRDHRHPEVQVRVHRIVKRIFQEWKKRQFQREHQNRQRKGTGQ